MPVFNPFQPWTYQNKPRQPKPATAEEVKPPTARPSPPPPTAGGGVVIEHTPGGMVEHGGVHIPPTTTPTSTGGAKPPTSPSGGIGTGVGKLATTGGGSTQGASTAIQSTAMSMAQQVISNYTRHHLGYGPGINSAESFLAYMNALKQSDPSLYNQLMSNPTIRQAMQYAQAYINYANSIVNWHLNPNPTMTKQQFAVTTANNLMTQINQNMQSGNYKQALQYAQMLKALAQQYGLPVNTQSLNTLINELTILSKLPQPPSAQPPRMSPQLMRALARTEPGFYTSLANVYYQNAYRQWMQYYNELMQLANEAQSMGLTDLADRLRAQASIANQMAQGYLVNYVLTSPRVQNFINTLNQYIQLLSNQPDPTTNPQAYLAWLGQVVAMSQQVRNAWQSVYPFLSQYQNIPQIQQLVQQGQYAQQLVQQVMQYAQQLQQSLFLSPSILNITPTSLTQLGGLGGVLTGSALMQSLVQLPPGTQITYTPLTTQGRGQRQNAWWSGLAKWYLSQLQLARQMATSNNPLLRALGGAYLGILTLGSGAVGFAENFGALATGFPGTMLVGLAEMPLIGTQTTMGPRSPVTQFLLGVGVPLAQTSEFLQSSANWTLQQAQQAWQGIEPQWEVRLPGWVRPITPLIEAFYPYVSNGRLVVSPSTVIGAIGYNLPLVLSGVGAVGGAMKGVGLGMAGEETLAGELTPELSTRLGMWLAERMPGLSDIAESIGGRVPWLSDILENISERLPEVTPEGLIRVGSALERVGAVGNMIDPTAWMARLSGEALYGLGKLLSGAGEGLEGLALRGLAKIVSEGTPEFYMLPRYSQYGNAIAERLLDLIGASGSTLARVGTAGKVIGETLATAFPMPWEYYTFRDIVGNVVMPFPRPLVQELIDYLRGVRYSPFAFSFPLVITRPGVATTTQDLGSLLSALSSENSRIGKTILETGTGTITNIETFGWEVPIVYRLPNGQVATGVNLVVRLGPGGDTAEVIYPVVTENGLTWMREVVPINKLDQTISNAAQKLAVELGVPPGATPVFSRQALYLVRIRTNTPGLGELTAFLTPQQIRQYRLLVGATQAFMPNELAEMMGITAKGRDVEAIRNAYLTLLASLLSQPPEVLENNPQLLLGLGGGLATQYMEQVSPTVVGDIMSRLRRTPASVFYDWFQNVLPYIRQAQRNIIVPNVGLYELLLGAEQPYGLLPLGRFYMPYAFGLAEVPIIPPTLGEAGGELITATRGARGTGALLGALGSGGNAWLVGPTMENMALVLNVNPQELMTTLAEIQNELAGLGITYRPFQLITPGGAPLYTLTGTTAGGELLNYLANLEALARLGRITQQLVPATTITGATPIEFYPVLSGLTREQAEAVLGMLGAGARAGAPTGAAGIMALPPTAEVAGETPMGLEELLAGGGSSAEQYLSALAGLRVAEETGGGALEGVAPWLVRLTERAGANLVPTQLPPNVNELIRQRIRNYLASINEVTIPPGLRQWGGNLLMFSWHAPGRINVSPPGVLRLFTGLLPMRTRVGTRQYYAQATPLTLSPIEIPPPPIPPITIQGQTTTTVQETPTQNPPTTATPVPPTAVPPVPPFLIPLLWFPSWMPTQYPLAGELARPGAMREILVL